jgi:hypothetical protein
MQLCDGSRFEWKHPARCDPTVEAKAGVAAIDWTTGVAPAAITPVSAAFRRNSRRSMPLVSGPSNGASLFISSILVGSLGDLRVLDQPECVELREQRGDLGAHPVRVLTQLLGDLVRERP